MRHLRLSFAVFILVAVAVIMCAGSAFAGNAGEMEMRGVWVSTVYNLDYPDNATTDETELKTQADRAIENCKNMGMNTIFLQVRPAADAFYSSEIFPWSKYLTGKQGVEPDNGFDPLSYWVEKAHENGMELHAWINPFRVAMSDAEFNALSKDNPARTNPDWVIKHSNGQYYFNPGIPEVRDLIVSGVQEIAKKYSVDGIHLDDYFYPDSSFGDEEVYSKYGADFSDIGDWRRDNVNKLVTSIKEVARGYDIEFGISIGGIWANSDEVEGGSDTKGSQTYLKNYADSREWVRQGWVDYICPQIYWNIGYDIADYDTLVRWWADTVRDTGVKLYIGMADYRVDNSDAASLWYGIDEIIRQTQLNRTIPEISGEVHFRYNFLADNAQLYEYYAKLYSGEDYDVQPEIEYLKHSPYMAGSNGKFNPDGRLTRAEAATLFARLITDDEGVLLFDANADYENSFADVPKSAWYAKAVGFMEQYKIITGYADGTFLPEKTISRAEFTALVSRFEKAEEKQASNEFSDVSLTHWAAGYIANAVEKGYVSGYGGGIFKPENSITRAETVKIVNRMLGRAADNAYISKNLGVNGFYDISMKHWAYYEIMEASFEHEYTLENGIEKWREDVRVEIPFVSDKIEFVFPELITTDPLDPLDLTAVKAIAVHHMAHPTADFKTIEGWHLDQGWRAFGYNFWIDFDGNVYVARGFNQAAGVSGKNSWIISIGFQGDYEESNKSMPKAQYNAGVELIKWISEKVPGIQEVGGHNDYGSTLCPGKYFPKEEMIADAGF